MFGRCEKWSVSGVSGVLLAKGNKWSVWGVGVGLAKCGKWSE